MLFFQGGEAASENAEAEGAQVAGDAGKLGWLHDSQLQKGLLCSTTMHPALCLEIGNHASPSL